MSGKLKKDNNPHCRIMYMKVRCYNMEYETKVDIELVIENATYASVVNLEIVQLMMQADVVTVRGNSGTVNEIEVTDNGVIRFHGNRTEF